MARGREPSRRGHDAARICRVALLAVLAVFASSLLPLAHGVATHAGDCAVCSVFAHNGAGVADVAAIPELVPAAAEPTLSPRLPDPIPPHPAFARPSARAPPASSVSI